MGYQYWALCGECLGCNLARMPRWHPWQV